MKKILIIGGNGFIGRNIVDSLYNRNYEIAVYDSKMSDYKNIKGYCGDIINDSQFASIISNYQIIIYLVSAIMPKMSMDIPLSAYQTDIPLLIKTLESCTTAGIKRIIYASSGGTIYGDNNTANTEDTPLNPINHYAICKMTCEKILLLYNKIYNMENVILRIANPYGKYQKASSGIGVVNIFTSKILHHETISLWGNGSNVRDYIDVQYVAQAFEKACNWRQSASCTPVFNIGSGTGLSLKQLIQIIAEETHITPDIQYLPTRKFDVKNNFLDITKAQNYLGYKIDEDAETSVRKYIKTILTEM